MTVLDEHKLMGEDYGFSADFYVHVTEDDRIILTGGEYGIILDDTSRKRLVEFCRAYANDQIKD